MTLEALIAETGDTILSLVAPGRRPRGQVLSTAGGRLHERPELAAPGSRPKLRFGGTTGK